MKRRTKKKEPAFKIHMREKFANGESVFPTVIAETYGVRQMHVVNELIDLRYEGVCYRGEKYYVFDKKGNPMELDYWKPEKPRVAPLPASSMAFAPESCERNRADSPNMLAMCW